MVLLLDTTEEKIKKADARLGGLRLRLTIIVPSHMFPSR